MVVLYNPDEDVIDNIKTYLNQIDKLFIIDNSDQKTLLYKELLSKLTGCEYISNNDNLGIAAALNIGAKKGIEQGYDFILTMDQDSRVPENIIQEIFYYTDKYNYDINTIGIISPFHYDNPWMVVPSNDIDEMLYVMTSGNLLNLKAFKSVGDFSEELFIDRVDDEYCMRLLMNGYKVLRINKILLPHKLGNISKGSILGRIQTFTNHSPVRRYYITRNSLYVVKKYKDHFPQYKIIELKSFFYEFSKILLFEREKIKKIIMIFKGIYHYKKGITGKLT